MKLNKAIDSIQEAKKSGYLEIDPQKFAEQLAIESVREKLENLIRLEDLDGAYKIAVEPANRWPRPRKR